MRPTENVIDFTHYRKRRQARLMAELMWTMYATRAAFTTLQTVPTVNPNETRQA